MFHTISFFVLFLFCVCPCSLSFGQNPLDHQSVSPAPETRSLHNQVTAEGEDHTPRESLSTTPQWIFSGKKSTQKWGIFPYYQRNDTYGHIFSGQGFIYPTTRYGYYLGLGGKVTQKRYYSVKLSGKKWYENGDTGRFHVFFNKFHDPYYGEGNNTLLKDFRYIPSRKVSLLAGYLANIVDHFGIGFFAEFRHRKELEQVIFKEQNIFPVGLALRWDSRNSEFNTKEGVFFQSRAWLNLPFKRDVVFLKNDLRLFFPLWREKLVLAVRAVTGLSLGFKHGFPVLIPVPKEDFLSRFSIGGPDLLRGYRINRFRGSHFYTGQLDLRLFPMPWLGMYVFSDAGAVQDSGFRQIASPHASFGGGVTFGFPPRYEHTLRLQYGVGKDQYSFLVDYGMSF